MKSPDALPPCARILSQPWQGPRAACDGDTKNERSVRGGCGGPGSAYPRHGDERRHVRTGSEGKHGSASLHRPATRAPPARPVLAAGTAVEARIRQHGLVGARVGAGDGPRGPQPSAEVRRQHRRRARACRGGVVRLALVAEPAQAGGAEPHQLPGAGSRDQRLRTRACRDPSAHGDILRVGGSTGIARQARDRGHRDGSEAGRPMDLGERPHAALHAIERLARGP